MPLALKRTLSLMDMFRMQRNRALRQGISWEFRFSEWLLVWIRSGKLFQRGPASHQYCMARVGDVGSYRADNIKIITNEENRKERRAPRGADHPMSLANPSSFALRAKHSARLIGENNPMSRANPSSAMARAKISAIVSKRMTGDKNPMRIAKLERLATRAREKLTIVDGETSRRCPWI